MLSRRDVFNSSVGMKLLIGVTGFALFLYLIIHILGNLIVFFGPAAFNKYAFTLEGNPLIPIIEIGLLRWAPLLLSRGRVVGVRVSRRLTRHPLRGPFRRAAEGRRVHAGGRAGALQGNGDRHKFEMKLVNPANKRKHTIIVVGTGLA